MPRFINPFTDVGFKRIFGQEVNKDLLIDFLNNLLEGEKRVTDITFLDKELPAEFEGDRGVIYDIYCTNEDGEQFIVEMQNREQVYFRERALYYLSQAVARQGEKGVDWKFNLKAVYGVFFMNFRLKDVMPDKFRTDVVLADRDTHEPFSDKLRFIFLQLPCFTKEEDECGNDFERWIYVLKNMETLQRMPFKARKAVFEKLEKIVDISTKLALSLKTKGLINIQYLIYQNQLYVIEVNPRASRTIPYISKVTGVPMVELATKIMVGAKLKKLGYGTGLYPNSPYVAVKVPVFSFEKLNDVNSQLGPEMKSTGEVLGIGKTIEEALFKGLVSAGFKMCHPTKENPVGVYFTVNDQDKFEIVSIAKKFADLGCNLYATAGTAKVISELGIDVTVVDRLKATKQVSKLMDEGKIGYIIYTGKTDVDSIADYIELHHHAILLGITVLTSLYLF